MNIQPKFSIGENVLYQNVPTKVLYIDYGELGNIIYEIELRNEGVSDEDFTINFWVGEDELTPLDEDDESEWWKEITG
jgi:hypothetical protein